MGPYREELRGNWRKLHHEELHDLYSLSNTVGRTRWDRHVARNVRGGEAKGKRNFGGGNLKGDVGLCARKLIP